MDLNLYKREYFSSGALSTQAIAFITLGIIAFVCVVLSGIIIWARLNRRASSNITNSHTRGANQSPSSRSLQINRTPKSSTPAVLTESQFNMLPRKSRQRPDTTDCQSLDLCTICLSDICFGDEMVTLFPCSHSYHIDCIRQWLTKKSIFCPLCKANIQVGLEADNVPPQQVEEANTNRQPTTITRPERARVERFTWSGWYA